MRRMRSLLTIVYCTIAIVILFQHTVKADNIYFVGGQFPILSEETEQGEFTGIGVDLARMICKKLGHTTTIKLLPWKRAQFMIRNGSADVLIAVYKRPKREEWLDFSDNYFFVDQTFLYAKPGTTIPWNGNLSSIKNFKFGLIYGWSLEKIFESPADYLDVDYAPTVESCIKKLLHGRIDIFPTQDREANAVFAKLGLSSELRPIKLYPPLATRYSHFGFNKQKNLSTFKAEFDKELGQLKTSGEIDRILVQKYGLRPSF